MFSLERTRIVTHQWARAPNGPLLTKPPPKGMRTPNGLIWAHSIDDFMWIERIPNVGLMTIWSRSMIKEYNENYLEEEFEAPEPRPRLRKPWPVLKLRKGARMWLDPPLSAMDEGSDHEDDGIVRYRILEDDSDDEDDEKSCCCATHGGSLFDHTDDKDVLLPNDSENPVMSPLGVPYSHLWSPELHNGFAYAHDSKLLSPISLIVPPGQNGKNGVKRAEAADAVGVVEVLVTEQVNSVDGTVHRLVLGPRLCFHPGSHSCACRHAGRAFNVDTPNAKEVTVPQPPLDVDMAEASAVVAQAGLSTDNDTANATSSSPQQNAVSAVSTDAAMKSGGASTLEGEHAVAHKENGVIETGIESVGVFTSPELNGTSLVVQDTPMQIDDVSPAEVRVASDVQDKPVGDSPDDDSTLNSSPLQVESDLTDAPMQVYDTPKSEPEGPAAGQDAADTAAVDEDSKPDHQSGTDVVLPQDSPVIVPETVVDAAPKEDITQLSVSGAAASALLEEKVDEIRKAKPPPLDNALYSTKDLPKLEEFIPEQFFPDVLMVHKLLTNGGEDREELRKYKRIFPKFDRDHPDDEEEDEEKDEEEDGEGDGEEEEEETESKNKKADKEERVGHLYLKQKNKLGAGNHSLVQRAPLTLPAPLTARSRSGQVTVAAKTALNLASAHNQLRNEAKSYDAFPKHLMQDWCGYNLVTPVKHPVPVGPVVPKFYGYYVPLGDNGEWEDEEYEGYDEYHDKRLRCESPILLMEECGDPIEPHKFNEDERSECYSLILRLHYENFVQQSMYVRNVLMQPGPLTAPPDKRSKKNPSFRIIDFGRAISWKDYVGPQPDSEKRQRKSSAWHEMVDKEAQKAREQLQISDWDY
ncbi:hypothetical protein BKA93DRAFT_749586 [Sparassis latifolia]